MFPQVTERKAAIGVFGGSGLYKMEGATVLEEIKVETPFGAPSDLITIVDIAGKRVAFLPRHGRNHQYPPHKVPYKANVWAMKALGVERILAPNAVGSLQRHIKPGDFVICDQFVDRTRHRDDTFFNGPVTTHVSTADPYCPQLRQIAVQACKDLGIPHHERGTVVVIEGPRFSTKAESRWFTQMGWEVINMTQYPEVVLAREAELCYVNISIVTDYDTGLVADGAVQPVSAEEVMRNFAASLEKARALLVEIVKRVPTERTCHCGEALKHARVVV
ncbi:S-methyl-5'-thioadenosine phosphorylase [bacterium HR17]|jgi:5'-methylthioadenosine phosphorylase|uniref:S-methyl-5'-thioadenosine phosphorylase n=1 Tax=Candidatus Fervidibacter japonicus TaxID=2035412 RepID=A0A2H5X993_9BACT|nr:S-methyl-5'-thioadenosine phosphorylase [bacterium HR17]